MTVCSADLPVFSRMQRRTVTITAEYCASLRPHHANESINQPWYFYRASAQQCCPSVRLSACLSRSGIASKRLEHIITFCSAYGSAVGLVYTVLYWTSYRNSDGVSPAVVLNTSEVGLYKFPNFRPISGYMWETIQNRAINLVTMER